MGRKGKEKVGESRGGGKGVDPGKVPIISAEEFRKAILAARKKTDKIVWDRMVEYLQEIVDTLAKYHKMPKFQVMQRHNCLKEIIRICGDLDTTGDVNRKDEKLVKKCKLLWASCIARLGYEQMKAIAVAGRHVTPPGLRGLSPDYKFERLNRPGRVAVHTDYLPTSPAERAANGPTTAADEAGLILTGNDDIDFYAVKKFIKSFVASGGTTNLFYMDDEQRKRYRLEFSPKGVYRRGVPLDTPTGSFSHQLTAFAVSPAGEFYAMWGGELESGLYLNHSSFMSGRPVICAGVLVVDCGHLVSISNNSGHYKPSVEDLQAACKVILDKGYIPKPDCIAIVMDGGGKHFPGFEGTEYYMPPIKGPAFNVPIREFADEGVAAVRRIYGAMPGNRSARRGSFLSRRGSSDEGPSGT